MLRGCETWEEFERIFRRSYRIPIENTIDRPVLQQLLESIG